MSSYHLAPDLIPYYLDAITRYRIKYLWGYTSSLHALAEEVLRRDRTDLRMTVAITNAEPLFDYQREAISAAFHCPVRETYGMAEIVMAASECEYSNLHQWPEIGITEVFEAEQPVSPGTVGDFICTGLLNADMPLIRYRLGDRGALSRESTCACGRTLPRLAHVEGRADDTLYTPDGRRVGRLDPVFKTRLPVYEAQIIQESLTRIRVLYIPAPDYTAAAGQSITERIQDRMGDVDVILEAVDHIPRTSNGKFRAVICNLPPEQKQHLAQAAP